MSVLPPGTDAMYRRMTEAAHAAMSRRWRVVLCTVVRTRCPNCIYDEINDGSSGIYNGTGPSPFTDTACPTCLSKGNIETLSKRVVEANVRFSKGNPKGDRRFAAGDIDEGDARMKVLIRDTERVKAADYIEVDGVRYRVMSNTPVLRGLESGVTSQFALKVDP